MEFQAKWIRTSEETGGVCPVFRKGWKTERKVERATLYLTALGVYEAHLNGKRVGNYVLAPGWTAYDKRLQYQEYGITDLLREENELTVTLGKGWFRSPMPDGKMHRTSCSAWTVREVFLEKCILYTWMEAKK